MSKKDTLSFLPEDYLERKAQRRTNAICAVLFLAVMGAIGSAFTITERSSRSIERQYADKQTEYTEEARRIQQADQMRDKQRRMAQQAELAASLLEKVPRSFLLADLTNSMPAGVSLLDFKLETRKRIAPPPAPASGTAFEQRKNQQDPKAAPPPPPVEEFDVNLKITGVANTDVEVASFISKLNGSELLRDVNLVISDEFKQDNVQLRKFTIEARLDPSAIISPTATAALGANR